MLPFLVGAYASMPADADQRRDYYAALAGQEWVGGLEIPWPGDFAGADPLVLEAVAPGWRNSLTMIPGTMGALGADPAYGLASPEADGRAAALAVLRQVRDRMHAAAQRLGRPLIDWLQLHSAPTRAADASAFARSLAEVAGWDWQGARIVIEHCDRYVEGQRPEKGFLPLDAEIAVARELGVGVHINWGRSVIEGRSAGVALEHTQAAAAAGVLVGVIFSGAAGVETPYGGAWVDGHPPLSDDEPGSLMTAAAVRAVADAARGAASLAYLGAKVCVPADATVAERVAHLRRIAVAAGAAQ